MLATSHHTTFHSQMVADDTAARKKLEKDRQAEAILKVFTKGTPVPLLHDSAANQLAMKNMMSPGCRVTRASVVKRTKKVVVPRKKKKNHPRHALPMFDDPVSLPVLPKYFARQPTNLVGQALKPLEIVDRSKWLHLYPDPWDPTRLSLVKKHPSPIIGMRSCTICFSMGNCLVGATEAAMSALYRVFN
jgi:hypothetical protein